MAIWVLIVMWNTQGPVVVMQEFTSEKTCLQAKFVVESKLSYHSGKVSVACTKK